MHVMRTDNSYTSQTLEQCTGSAYTHPYKCSVHTDAIARVTQCTVCVYIMYTLWGEPDFYNKWLHLINANSDTRI